MIRTSTLIFIGIYLLSGCAAKPKESVENEIILRTDVRKASYAQGVAFMKNLHQDDVAFDQESFLLGLNDVRNNNNIRLSPSDLQKATDWVFAQRIFHNNKVAAINLAAGKAFLETNRSRPGVKTLASGLQYKIVKDGKGSRKPTLSDNAYVRYRISRIDGKELTSTQNDVKLPAIHVGSLVKGWQEALLLMSEGAKWQLYVPSDLAYGEEGAPDGRLGPNEALIYDVELVGVQQKTSKNALIKAGQKPATALPRPTSSWRSN
ncbi:MAG: hypothetical protein HOP23_02935 [Methylococcaceae bacterium]|nr:hypothetical protein [Methylococcaceae bacterium]